MPIGGPAQVVEARGAAGADLSADHPLRHQGVPVAPGREVLVDVHQDAEQAEGQLQHRLVAVEVDEERGLQSLGAEPPGAFGGQLGVRRRVEDRFEAGQGRVERGDLGLQGLFRQGGVATHRLLVAAQGAQHGLAVGGAELVAGPADEGRPLQPGLDLVEEGGGRLGLGDARALRLREQGVVGLVGVGQALGPGQAEAGLQQAELQALEARSRKQQVAEIKEVEGRHALEHVELLDQQLLDPRDPRQAVDRLTDLAVVGDRSGEDLLDPVELEEDQLEPELVGLVNDDEKHLVVGRLALEGALALLAGEQPVEPQMLGVGQGPVGIAHGRGAASSGLTATAGTVPPGTAAAVAGYHRPPRFAPVPPGGGRAVLRQAAVLRSSSIRPSTLPPDRSITAPYSCRRVKAMLTPSATISMIL